MAPMTRSRTINLTPTQSTVLYYRQRSSAGLIITEGTHVSEEGRGQAYTPGIYTREQIQDWRSVTDAIHEEGSAVFVQLWHVGRNSHVSHQPNGQTPVSSTNVASRTETWGFEDGELKRIPTSTPRALQTEEVARVTQDFVNAAFNAITAGFDGVELHGANGYLLEQFINGALNDREDRYGGSIENRIRFTLETVDAVIDAIGADRTGIRISPFGRFGDLDGYSDEEETWLTLARELSNRNLAYLHVSDQRSLGTQAIPDDFMRKLRVTYQGTLIVAGDFGRDNGQAALDENRLDLVAIGRPFIANPDLVERYKNGWPVAEINRDTLYSRGDEGYIDYPHYSAK
jgi:2,4-dienoyl-CoA reductase-like NADH-dependent reductase (Old Yellow Enzyme family)